MIFLLFFWVEIHPSVLGGSISIFYLILPLEPVFVGFVALDDALSGRVVNF
jgi:EamA domain-containing membrane protein RarD